MFPEMLDNLASISISTFRRYLTRPIRLRSIIFGLTRHVPRPTAQTIKLDYDSATPVPLRWGSKGSFCHLLPGGRWLITSASHEYTMYLFCWDILDPEVRPKQCCAMFKMQGYICHDRVCVEVDSTSRTTLLLVHTIIDGQEFVPNCFVDYLHPC